MFRSQDISIDLGTSSVLIYIKGKGVVLNEPTVVAVNTENGRILKVGYEAQNMLGRTPGNVIAVKPLKDGVVSDYDTTQKMLEEFIHKVFGRKRIFAPRAMVCVPSGVTNVEKRSVREAVEMAGCRKVYTIEEPLAAAIGAGLDISLPRGSMVVDIGGGTTDIAVLSMGKSVVSRSIKVAGNKFDEAIVRYVKKRHNLYIGDRTAEMIKITIGSAIPRKEPILMEATGRSLLNGLPKTIQLSSAEMVIALEECVQAIIDGVRQVFDETPPELSGDIYERGIIMTGGGALLFGLDKIIADYTNVPVALAEDPQTCVAIGTGKCLENLDYFIDDLEMAERIRS